MDPHTLAKLRAGDRALFAALVKDHHHALLALASAIVDKADAEEIVQNTWIKAYRAIAGFEGRAQVRTWLARITINEARQHLRQRRESLFGDLTTEADGIAVMEARFSARGSWQHPPASWHNDSPDNLLMGEELADCLQRLLDALPASQRTLLEMRDASGLDFEEICNELDISASNARVLLHRARRQLFALVDHYQETGEC